MMQIKPLYIVIGIVVVAIIAYYLLRKPSPTPGPVPNPMPVHESFVTAGNLQSIGIADPDGMLGNYELVPGNTSIVPSLDSSLKATDFAELVNSGDQAIQVATAEASHRPLERLQHLSDSYFPTVASKAIPFSQEAAKPLTFTHAVNLPRVNLKGKLYEMNLAESIRGTLSINYDPNVSLVSASQYRNEDVFNPGYMTSAFNSLHDKLTGGYKNLPMYIAGAGSSVANSVAGNAVEAIFDSSL